MVVKSRHAVLSSNLNWKQLYGSICVNLRFLHCHSWVLSFLHLICAPFYCIQPINAWNSVNGWHTGRFDTKKWSIFTEGLLSTTHAEPVCRIPKQRSQSQGVTIDTVVWNYPIERHVWGKFVNKAQKVNQPEAEYKHSLSDCTTTGLWGVRWLATR